MYISEVWKLITLVPISMKPRDLARPTRLKGMYLAVIGQICVVL